MTANSDWVVQPGTTVYGSDGSKIGEVDDIQDQYLVLRKGFFFPKDHYIPFSAIASHTDDSITLNVTGDEATNRDWDVAPTGSATATTTTTIDTTQTGYVDTVAARGTDTDEIRVPVVEEQLEARKQAVERGHVRVETRVSETEQTLSVPVTEERVHVERVTVDRDATAADLSASDAVIDVPVYGEEVDLDKRARVVEEVRIAKDAVQETREVSGTVRREDVEVVDGTVTGGTARTTASETYVEDIDPATGQRRRS